MSYDLHVYAKQRLQREQLIRLVHGAALDVEPNSKTDKLLTVIRGSRKQYSFTLGDGVAIEADDVPDEIAAVVLAPKWMYEIVVEGSSSLEAPHAIRFARALATAAQGVVLDRQSGQTWSRGQLRAVASVDRGRTDIVELRWYTLRTEEPEDLAERWLAHARHYLPEALPRRFGPVEPLTSRLDREGETAFVSGVATERMTMFFAATQPCIGGHLAGRRSDWHARGHGLSVHRRPLEANEWRAALRQFFVAIARSSLAFYASAEVISNIVWSGRGIGYDILTERATYLAPRGRWYGLPPYPVWWSWFGAVYRPLVSSHLPAERTTPIGGGILYEAAVTPSDRDELRLASSLPASLLTQLQATDPRLFNPALVPASELPKELQADAR